MLKSERIMFRPMKKEDAEFFEKYQSDPDVTDNLFMGPNLGTIKEFIEHWYDHVTGEKEGFTFVIATKEGDFLGSCNTMWLNWHSGTTYIAISISHPDYRSKGYGTEALTMFIDFLFNEAGLRKVKLNVFGFNKRAIRCYEKCGFKIDGINRKELFRHGEYQDTYAMSITRDEYNRRNCTCTAEA